MEALFIVLNHESHYKELLLALQEAGIHGGTILESQGMAGYMAEHFSSFKFNYLGSLLNEGRPYNKTIILVLDKERTELAKNCVRKVVGDLDQENVGIMFTFDVTSFEGLTK
ncbi:MAG: hypothetical protein Q4E36_06215 [Bacillota bacterium]|nr:hypothetical protein [Bacillota bacterium]